MTEPKYLNEAKVKLLIGDWLTELGFGVFDEKENGQRPQWGLFKVGKVNRGKQPDLVVFGNMSAAHKLKKGIYVAIEIKRGYKHHDILDGFDATLDYFSDYMWGAEYKINSEIIQISAFVFATVFSKDGFLFKEEGKFSPRHIVKGPWDAYPMTFTISRLLWRQKDNLVKRFQTLSGIPKVERKIKGIFYARGPIPDIGVLVCHPTKRDDIRMMLSENPYHWRFEASGGPS
jgi:hypothetical protein